MTVTDLLGIRHGGVAFRLRRLLDRQAPDGFAVSSDLGIQIGSVHTYFIPDLFVIPEAGTTWATDVPFPLRIDPADVC